MSNQPTHNQVWIHPDGTWSSMRRDGSFNFIYAVPAMLKLRGSDVPLDSNAASFWYGKYIEQRDIADDLFEEVDRLRDRVNRLEC